MYALLDFGNRLSWIEPFGTDFGTVHDLMAPIKLVGIINLRHSLLRKIITGINDPPTQGNYMLHKPQLQATCLATAHETSDILGKELSFVSSTAGCQVMH